MCIMVVARQAEARATRAMIHTRRYIHTCSSQPLGFIMVVATARSKVGEPLYSGSG